MTNPPQVSAVSIILTCDASLLKQPDVVMKDLFLHSAQGPFNSLPTADHVRQITHLNTYIYIRHMKSTKKKKN